uniref:Uncharacterized protein n=1 Tax=Nelumbo nucifera TaxID=4432 RepID=A0A822ZFS2_NELNU|nr:TPA_asm: hypothetical protein HUJ06_001957 [Nelumbo nucifera]
MLRAIDCCRETGVREREQEEEAQNESTEEFG